MSWYYADAGRQVGPVEEPALDDLVRAGVVRDDTLVWREGMANWQPHGAVRGPKPPVPMPAVPIGADSSFCSECGRPFPTNQLVAIGNANVCAQCKPLYLQRMREGGQAIGARRYAGFWIRFVAWLIDAVIVTIVGFIINLPLRMLASYKLLNDPATIFSAGAGILGLVTLINLLLWFAYTVYFISTRGATPGKLILGLKIVRSDGSPVTAGRAIGRGFGWLLSYFTILIGFIIAGFDSQKRALHDHLCDTRVIYAT
jgi:uncharacterized RDD family membrane protein YckC